VDLTLVSQILLRMRRSGYFRAYSRPISFDKPCDSTIGVGLPQTSWRWLCSETKRTAPNDHGVIFHSYCTRLIL